MKTIITQVNITDIPENERTEQLIRHGKPLHCVVDKIADFYCCYYSEAEDVINALCHNDGKPMFLRVLITATGVQNLIPTPDTYYSVKYYEDGKTPIYAWFIDRANANDLHRRYANSDTPVAHHARTVAGYKKYRQYIDKQVY